MLSCLWIVNGPLLWGHKAQAGDGDGTDDDGAEAEVDRKCVLHQPAVVSGGKCAKGLTR